jgi:hypothetical protein
MSGDELQQAQGESLVFATSLQQRGLMNGSGSAHRDVGSAQQDVSISTATSELKVVADYECDPLLLYTCILAIMNLYMCTS